MTLTLTRAEAAILVSALGFEDDRLCRLARAQATLNFRRPMILRAGLAHDLRARVRAAMGSGAKRRADGHRVGGAFGVKPEAAE